MKWLLFLLLVLGVAACAPENSACFPPILETVGEGNLESFIDIDLLKKHYGIDSEVQTSCLLPTNNDFIHGQECELKWQDSTGKFVGLKVSQTIMKNPETFQKQVQKFEKLFQQPAAAPQWEELDLCQGGRTFLYIPDLRYTILAKDSIVFSLGHSRRLFPNSAYRDGIREVSEGFLRALL
ncbi:MAG: hypothetical protein AAFV80_10785 [Bacteroidota bacterium]